jgi:hypothetical protein
MKAWKPDVACALIQSLKMKPRIPHVISTSSRMAERYKQIGKFK